MLGVERATTRTARGQWAERLAARWLVAHGWTLLTRNFRCRGGELDLVVQQADVVAFVEVRSRRRGAPASALESVTPRKQLRLARAASRWLQDRPPGPVPSSCRFDVITVRPERNGDYTIRHVPGAFVIEIAVEQRIGAAGEPWSR